MIDHSPPADLDPSVARHLSATTAYLNSGASQVPGFLTRGAAAAIVTVLVEQLRADVRGALAEIGVYHGKLFIALALARRPGEIALAVDLFSSRRGDFEATFRNNCVTHGVPIENVHILRADSQHLTPDRWVAALGMPARIVHVDGLHTRKAVLHDLALAASHLAPAGVIVIDDIFHPWYPDVTEGIYAFLGGHPELVPVAYVDRTARLLDGGAKLIVAPVVHASRYRAAINSTLKSHIVKAAPIAGTPTLILAFDREAELASPQTPSP
ncbi:MAG TPA: class I SAM-dependent methyltransferase [Alphaproteobacteria bacterium]|nr:class I SAM-dependent methyltransferase [Alphaproteobacteria bacterium]